MQAQGPAPARKPGSHHLYQEAEFNQASFYRSRQSLPPELYRPIAAWMGRLILPGLEQRHEVKGVLFELYHAGSAYRHLEGQVVNLRWSDDLQVQARVWAVTRNVHFSQKAEKTSRRGMVHPDRLNHWPLVNPLESLAGMLPRDEVVVKLREPVVVEASAAPGQAASLYICRDPIQISGRFYALVQFLPPSQNESDLLLVAHYNRASGQFDGPQETVRLPQVIANVHGIFLSSNREIEKSPLNGLGWYIYGAQDQAGVFTVQAIAPRVLLRRQPDQVIFGEKAGFHYIKKRAWQEAKTNKGQVSTTLLCPQEQDKQEAVAQWREGDQALVIHVYGGVGGKKCEPMARTGIYFGHFSYGIARVVREPLADELGFEIEYHQVYTNNIDGVICGTLSWLRYMGDRQWGWLGARPVCDLLIKLDALTEPYDFYGVRRSALDELAYKLEMITARYRIGDGVGGTYVSAANNCAQDSNQALYQAIRDGEAEIRFYPHMQNWQKDYPEQAERLERLVKLKQALKYILVPFGRERSDWKYRVEILGSSLEDSPIRNLVRGLTSWRTVLPRVASDHLARVFLKHGAAIWVLRTNQVGGFDPDIEPIAPLTF